MAFCQGVSHNKNETRTGLEFICQPGLPFSFSSFLWDRVSLSCSSWSGTHYGNQAGLRLPKIHLLELKMCATRPYQASLKLINSSNHPALASQEILCPAHENTSENWFHPSGSGLSLPMIKQQQMSYTNRLTVPKCLGVGLCCCC